MAEQRKAVIKNADMSEDMQQDAVDIASQALSKYNIEKVSALSLSLSHKPEHSSCGCVFVDFCFDSQVKGIPLPFLKCTFPFVEGNEWFGHFSWGEVVDPASTVLHGRTPHSTSPSPLVFSHACSILSHQQDVAAYIKKEFDKKHSPTW